MQAGDAGTGNPTKVQKSDLDFTKKASQTAIKLLDLAECEGLEAWSQIPELNSLCHQKKRTNWKEEHGFM